MSNTRTDAKVKAAFGYAESAFAGETESEAPAPIVVGRAYVRVNNGAPEIALMTAIDGAGTAIRGLLSTQRYGNVVVERNDMEFKNWRMLPLNLLITEDEMEQLGHVVALQTNEQLTHLQRTQDELLLRIAALEEQLASPANEPSE